MSTHRIILCCALLVLALGVLTPQVALEASTGAQKPDQEGLNRALLLGFLRTINTAEVMELSKHGSYAPWPTLLAHQAEYLNGWLVKFYSQDANAHFGDMPEVLPSLKLRLNVHLDGQGYDVLLEDVTDQYGYAALSDERGIIRECKWL
jgi:hypothetical protein